MPESTVAGQKRPHVVVVGGGFGGIAAVRKLKRADVDVTLIDRHTYNTFQPLLYQVATASLNPGDITWFLRAIRAKQSNVRFLKGLVESMDHETKTLKLDGGVEVKYDYLVIAVGVTANFFGIPGAAEFAMPLYRRSQALAVRDKMFAALEEAAVNGQDRDLRIIVVGGGATGVETAGAFAELRNNDMPVTYPELDRKRMHITLIEMMPHVLGPFHPKLASFDLVFVTTNGGPANQHHRARPARLPAGVQRGRHRRGERAGGRAHAHRDRLRDGASAPSPGSSREPDPHRRPSGATSS